jgi:NADH-quinone oxidoreductase subunit G
MFLTETAQRADVVLPAASVYDKNGTVTNVCGEVQRLKAGLQVMGSKPDLEIIGLIGKEMGVDVPIWSSEKVFDQIRANVHGYNIPLLGIATGGAAQTTPVNGRVNVSARPELIQSARDSLFTSGTLGRYSKTLNSVLEAPGGLYSEERP